LESTVCHLSIRVDEAVDTAEETVI
jgi:hypothetical protein